MYLEAIAGATTLFFTIAVKVIGLPDQILKNHRRASTDGLSTIYCVTGFASYCSWTLYGALRGDWVVILGQSLGIATTGVILVQILLYRKRTRT